MPPSVPARHLTPRTFTSAVLGALAALLAAVALAVAAPSASGGPLSVPTGTSYGLPLEGAPDVARAFERPANAFSAGHRGVDLRSVEGATVLAPADGIVTFAGQVAGRGVVTLAHPDGRRSSLEPVSPAVAVGARIVRGQPVGALQTAGSHCAPAVCLHWGVRVDTTYEDPLAMLPGAGPVVLLSSRMTQSPDHSSVRRARRPGVACAGGPSPPCASGRSATR
ncbi:M23 family metallopeptidase [Cellulomonas sp. URHE0023]|uniref:M23 family metallopeptidase n=1 Tax=Cellulomonas sp. URHE0023 TaxID=1380354 RepID=UPI00048A1A5C|nr:M23 family metallopeptidase [Cellulomonas sp. URHE0023]